MADTYRAKQVVSEALNGLEDNEEVQAAWRTVTDALYEEQDRARRAETVNEAYRRAITDLMAGKAGR